jgi:hypothetical protein
MTITSIDQVYGVRMSKVKFYRWMLNNKDHEWYKVVEKCLNKDRDGCTEFEKYIASLEEKNIPVTYYDLHNELISDLVWETKENKDYMCISALTHDTGSEDLIIGIIMSTILLKGSQESIWDQGRDFFVDPEFQLQMPFNMNHENYNDYFDELVNSGLIENHDELRKYSVSNDCHCCS